MKPTTLLQTAILPALAELEALGIKSSPLAARFVLAIALQESKLRNRRQVVAGGAENGPATSFWQGEKGGGICTGTLTHPSTSFAMKTICDAYNVFPTPGGLWEAIRYQDIVAAAGARLLVYTLPGSLPKTADQGWAQYVDAWRPGKPHPETWAENWRLASETVGVL